MVKTINNGDNGVKAYLSQDILYENIRILSVNINLSYIMMIKSVSDKLLCSFISSQPA